MAEDNNLILTVEDSAICSSRGAPEGEGQGGFLTEPGGGKLLRRGSLRPQETEKSFMAGFDGIRWYSSRMQGPESDITPSQHVVES